LIVQFISTSNLNFSLLAQVLGPPETRTGARPSRVRRVRTQAEIESKTAAVRQRYNVGESSKSASSAAGGKKANSGVDKLKETISTGLLQATETGE